MKLEHEYLFTIRTKNEFSHDDICNEGGVAACPIWGLPNDHVSAISEHNPINSRVAVDRGGGAVLGGGAGAFRFTTSAYV